MSGGGCYGKVAASRGLLVDKHRSFTGHRDTPCHLSNKMGAISVPIFFLTLQGLAKYPGILSVKPRNEVSVYKHMYTYQTLAAAYVLRVGRVDL